ncbi:sulfotransferase family 2 domain-containing protein [Granulosicoccus sp. 3-233]|uniref:sulfotransferase family 2 domain-containing protein n=1 Tax=Granulosicoccus sp. 3-233 TaxID=3417969 RepID=UPI003D35627E
MRTATTLWRARLKDFRSFSNRYPYRRYANRHRIVFIHIPKTGGTSILDALGAGLNDRMHLNWRIYRHANKYRFQKYYKFAVVRHPHDRLRSVYHYLMRGGCGANDSALCEDIRRRAPTFETFIMDYLSRSSLVLHNLFMPQAWFVCDELGHIMTDRILRFENLNKEFSALAQEQGWNLADLPHRNTGTTRIDDTPMSQECAVRIHELYEADFDIFDYTDTLSNAQDPDDQIGNFLRRETSRRMPGPSEPPTTN